MSAKKISSIKIVLPEWLSTSLKASKVISEDKYELEGPVATSDTEDNKDESPEPTRLPSRGAKRQREPKNEVDADEETPAPAKKARGRKAKNGIKQHDSDKADIKLTTKDNGKTDEPSKALQNDHDDDENLDAKSNPEEDIKVGKVTKDGQMAKSASMNVPVDDYCPLNGSHKVLIESDGTIMDVTLNQTNAGANNNKFYRLQLLEGPGGKDYWTWSRWGRVGEKGQSKMLGSGGLDDARRQFESKFKDKSGLKWENRLDTPRSGKYTFLERSYEDSENGDSDSLPGAGKRRASKESIKSEPSDIDGVDSKLPGPVQRLMEVIFNKQYFDATMTALNYDANKMPLGKLSKRTLKQGFEILKELAALINGTGTASDIQELSNSYLSTVPHAFGRSRPPVISNKQMIDREIELLEALTDMQLANEIMKTAKSSKCNTENLLDKQYAGLGMTEMTPLDMKSTEFRELSDYLIKSAGSTHNMKYKVHDIFRIERSGERARFEDSEYAKVKQEQSDKRLLWHGSRCTNFGGILSQGLRIAPPEAPVSGYMFGKGVYLADISTKSAGYCASNTSNNIGLLLLCEAELGKPPYKLTRASYDADKESLAAGALSTWGVGSTVPKGWKDARCVHESLAGTLMPDTGQGTGSSDEPGVGLLYNEYIVYNVAQIRLRYLLRVEVGHGFID